MQCVKFSILALLLSVGVASAAALDDVVLPTEIPDEPFDIQAGRLEYTNDTLVASGGVTGRFENVTIRADRLSGSQESGDLSLEGNILFERGAAVWQGSKLEYNYITQTGDFGPSTLNFDPILMSVDQVQRVSTNEYLMQGASFTTCTNDHSHFHVRAKKARLVDGNYLQAYGVGVYVGKVPVLYVPYWYQHLNQRIFTFRVGYGSEWGPFTLIKATVPVTKNVDWISDFNLYGKRGVGFGQGLDWRLPDTKGKFKAFYINDQDAYSRFNESPEREQIGDDRFRFKLENQHHFSAHHYVNTRLNYLSDPTVIEEFFKPEFRQTRQPENYSSWVVGSSAGATEGFVSKRLNDYYDNVDRAEYSADLYRTRLGNSPFYLQSENAVAHLERVYSETNSVNSKYDTVRLDSYNALTLPQRYGFLRVIPRATYRATYYSQTAAANGLDEEVRHIPGVGTEVAFHAAKVLSEQRRWYGHGLRHKIEPYADYSYEDSSVETNRLLRFDGVDELADAHNVKLGLRNVLQTRRDGRLARFVDLDLYTHYLIDNEGSEDFSSLFIDARMPLTKTTMLDMEGEYDWFDGQVDFFSTRLSHKLNDDLEVSLGHLYRSQQQSLWTPRVSLFPEEDISFEAYARYDDDSNDLQEVMLMGFKSWCCMRYGLGIRFYDDEEVSLMLSLGLSAFPEESVGSGF